MGADKSTIDRAKSHCERGHTYCNEGNLDQAIEEWKRATELDPKLTEARYNLAIAYAEKRLWDEAIAEMETVVRLEPSYGPAHYYLGVLYERARGWKDRAAEEYKKAIEVDPSDVEPRIALGDLYEQKGLVDKALEEYTQAARLDPGNVVAHYNLGRIYGKKNLWENAKTEFEHALPLASDDSQKADICFLLAVACVDTMNFDLAWKYVRSAEKLGRSSEDISSVIRKLEAVSKEPRDVSRERALRRSRQSRSIRTRTCEEWKD